MARLDRPGALAARVILLHELIWACRHAFARPAGVAPARFPAELAACLIARPIV